MEGTHLPWVSYQEMVLESLRPGLLGKSLEKTDPKPMENLAIGKGWVHPVRLGMSSWGQDEPPGLFLVTRELTSQVW